MPNESFLTRRQIKCDVCGGEIRIPSSDSRAILQCGFCGTIFEYNPAIRFVSTLVFSNKNNMSCHYDLTNNVILGRRSDNGYIVLRYEMDESIEQNTHIRNPFVSRQHARIQVREEFIFFPKEGLTKVIAKKKCYIEDRGSMNGTSVNHDMLKPHELRELKHGDRITLAPLGKQPLTATFEETERST